MMEIKIKTYENREEYKKDSMIGYRALHQDFIKEKFRVTWVNGTDNPSNNTRTLDTLTERQFIQRLARSQGIRINFSFKDRVKGILGM